jgi:hypothetical protein
MKEEFDNVGASVMFRRNFILRKPNEILKRIL